jgi:IS605 OrfB family transposase
MVSRIKSLPDKTRVNFQDLRNSYITKETKMNHPLYLEHKATLQEKKNNLSKEQFEEHVSTFRKKIKEVNKEANPNITSWEASFHKEIRASALSKVCDAYKTGFANLKKRNIKSFDVSFMKANNPRQCMELASSLISIKKGKLNLPFFKEHSLLKVSKKMERKIKNMKITHNCDFVKQKNNYWLHIPIDVENEPVKEVKRFSGVDPGVIKIATTFGNGEVVEYTHNRELLKKYNQKINLLKERRKRVRKKQINKVEKKKIDYTDRLHWTLINKLLEDNDLLYYGDIKSHDISKDGPNKYLNQELNDIKFYTFKTRLIYKAKTLGKKVIVVNERYTSMTCSTCGFLEKIENRIHKCKNCKTISDRDINSSKNILMRGLLEE